MNKRLVLPFATARQERLDVTRKRLGGLGMSEDGAGDLVSFVDEQGARRLGAVLFVKGDALDVWTPGGFVRRLRREATRPADAALPAELAVVAEAARAFVALEQGQRVRYRDETTEQEGLLVEKCRFGGIVARDDGSLVAIGFARIHDLSPPTSEGGERMPDINSSGSARN